MKPTRLLAHGFTLAELLVAVTLMAVVLAGLFALQDTLLRDQGKVLRDISVRNSADVARRMLLRDIGEATVIQNPTLTETSSKELVGWKNLDPFNINCNCGACFPSDVCANACTGGAALMSNWISLVDLPKDASGMPDPIGTTAPNNARQYGDDVAWFRYCVTSDGRLMHYRGAMRVGAANTVACPVANSCDAGCGATSAPNCIAEEIVGRPATVVGGFPGEGAFRKAGRHDRLEASLDITTLASIGGQIQTTKVQVVLSGQLSRGTR